MCPFTISSSACNVTTPSFLEADNVLLIFVLLLLLSVMTKSVHDVDAAALDSVITVDRAAAAGRGVGRCSRGGDSR